MGAGKDLWNEFESTFNKRDWLGVASLYARDAIYSTPNFRHDGRAAIRAFCENVGSAVSDINIETSLVIEEGDTVVAEWMSRLTHTGSLTMADGTEITATGKMVEHPGVTISQVRDGKFASMREYFDSALWMRQLGLMPST